MDPSSQRIHLQRGISIWEWVGGKRALSKVHSENAKDNLDVMLDAINALRKSGDASSARAELGTSRLTAKDIDYLEGKLFRNFRIAEAKMKAQVALDPIVHTGNPLTKGIDLLAGARDRRELGKNWRPMRRLNRPPKISSLPVVIAVEEAEGEVGNFHRSNKIVGVHGGCDEFAV